MIVAAAIKIDGRVYGLPAPARHHDIIRRLARDGMPTPISGEQGFIDDQLGFLGRTQALHRAKDEHQTGNTAHESLLFSEDLW